MERACLPALRAVAMLEHATSARALRSPLLLIEDPYQQVNPENPFHVALGDAIVHDRLRAVHRVLEVHDDRVKIVLDEWNTWIIEYSKNPEYFSAEELASPARVILVLNDPLDESPDLIFQGVITQLLFDRLPLMKGNYRKAFDEGSARLRAAVKEKAKESEALRQRLAQMSDEELDYQIHETVKLRITWILKIRFYERNVRHHPELLFAHLDNPRHATVLDSLAALDAAPLVAEGQADFDTALRAEFVAFYSQNISQHLDPEVVHAVWPIPLSGLWESSMLFPDMLQPSPVGLRATMPTS